MIFVERNAMNSLVVLRFEQKINAPRPAVWEALWSEEGYPYWTSIFSEGSQIKVDWKQGGRVHFISTSGNGMYSEIASLIPGEQVTFRHLGEIKEGNELEENQSWTGATERYSLREEEGATLVSVEMQTISEAVNQFNDMFPKAFLKLKEYVEQRHS